MCFLQMSMWRCNEELRVRAERQRCAKRDAKHYIGLLHSLTFFIEDFNSLLYFAGCMIGFWMNVEFWKQIPANEPYRAILGDVRDKLYNTRERARQLLSSGVSDIPEDAVFTSLDQVCFLVVSRSTRDV